MEMFLAVLLGVVASDAPVVSNPGFEQVREQISQFVGLELFENVVGHQRGWRFL